MKRRIPTLLLALVLCLCLLTSALAAGSGTLDNFKPVNTYTPGQFTDVPANHWASANIGTAYELGLVSGTSATTFAPDDNITVGSVLALACRLHSIYHTGKAEFVQGDPWYQVYVGYAVQNGIIKSGQYYESAYSSDYTKNATRKDVAAILAHAVPAEALEARNIVDDGMIPDVSSYDRYSTEIYTLYRAGVLTGSDQYGTFQPSTEINRASVAAMVTRVANPALRQEITLADPKVARTITLDQTEIAVGTGYSDRVTLTPSFAPSTANEPRVTWTSSDESVATVYNGRVEGKNPGTCTITATIPSGATAECQVTVSTYVTKVSYGWNEDSASVMVGDTVRLSPTVTPEDATDKTLTWTSSNPSVAAVDSSGLVTGLSRGEATITATSHNGKSADCTVTVMQFNTIQLNYEYGPMVANDASYNINNISSFVITGVEVSGSNYRITASTQGTSNYPFFNIKLRFYDSNNRQLGSDYKFLTSIEENVPYNINTSVSVPKDVLDNAVRMEFVTSNGKTVTMGSGSGTTTPSNPTTPSTGSTYYAEYPSVPDFGTYLGISRAMTVPLSDGGYSYAYSISAVNNSGNEDWAVGYGNLLRQNGFSYLDSFYDDYGNPVLIYEGKGLTVMLGIVNYNIAVVITDSL